jgi:hypothetical protein
MSDVLVSEGFPSDQSAWPLNRRGGSSRLLQRPFAIALLLGQRPERIRRFGGCFTHSLLGLYRPGDLCRR